MTAAQLVQCMKDYGTLSGSAFAAKYPEVMTRKLSLARLSNSHTWDIGSAVFIDIAREIEL